MFSINLCKVQKIAKNLKRLNDPVDSHNPIWDKFRYSDIPSIAPSYLAEEPQPLVRLFGAGIVQLLRDVASLVVRFDGTHLPRLLVGPCFTLT